MVYCKEHGSVFYSREKWPRAKHIVHGSLFYSIEKWPRPPTSKQYCMNLMKMAQVYCKEHGSVFYSREKWPRAKHIVHGSLFYSIEKWPRPPTSKQYCMNLMKMAQVYCKEHGSVFYSREKWPRAKHIVHGSLFYSIEKWPRPPTSKQYCMNLMKMAQVYCKEHGSVFYSREKWPRAKHIVHGSLFYSIEKLPRPPTSKQYCMNLMKMAQVYCKEHGSVFYSREKWPRAKHIVHGSLFYSIEKWPRPPTSKQYCMNLMKMAQVYCKEHGSVFYSREKWPRAKHIVHGSLFYSIEKWPSPTTSKRYCMMQCAWGKSLWHGEIT